MPGFAVFTYHFTTFSYIGKDMTALLLTSFLLGVQVSGLFRLCYFSKWLNDLGKGIFIPELSLSSNENKCPLTGIEEEIKRLHSNSFTLDKNMILFTCEVLAMFEDSTSFHSSPYLKRVQGIQFVFASDHSSLLKRQRGDQ